MKRVAVKQKRPVATNGAPEEIEIELPRALSRRLNRLSRASGRSVSALIGECVEMQGRITPRSLLAEMEVILGRRFIGWFHRLCLAEKLSRARVLAACLECGVNSVLAGDDDVLKGWRDGAVYHADTGNWSDGPTVAPSKELEKLRQEANAVWEAGARKEASA